MDPVVTAGIIIGLLFLLFLIGLPIALSLGVAGFLGLLTFYSPDQASALIARRLHDYLANFTFTAVPLFILMGFFALHAGYTRDAFNSARLWLGNTPGGLASATVAASGMFAACAGSGLPAAAALGRTAVPEMTHAGYDRRIAAGVVAAATPLAVLIPPSIVMIVYGIVTEASIGQLMIAGIIPGIVALLIFIAGVTLLAFAKPEMMPGLSGEFTWAARFASLRHIWGIVVLFVVVIGSIYTGMATPTEAAGVGASGALLLGLVMRRLSLPDILSALVSTAVLSATLFLIVVMASIFTLYIVRSGAVEALTTFVLSFDFGVISLLVVLSAIFIVIGFFLDSVSMIVLTMPALLPILAHMDIDLIWFGIILIIWVEIAAITPPFGISVFAVKSAVGDSISLSEIFQGAFFFVLLWIVVLALIIAFPQISLWLPGLMRT